MFRINNSQLKRILKILKIIGLSIAALLVLVIILLNITPVQNFVAGQATRILSKQMNTKVAVEHVRLDFLNQLVLQGVYIEDQKQDTLLYAGEARVNITDWFIIKSGTPVLKYIGLKNAYANLYRPPTSDVWNYQFIIDAFDNKKEKKEKQLFDITLEEFDLHNVRFFMNDGWTGSDLNFIVGSFIVNADDVNFDKKKIHLDEIVAKETQVIIRNYPGGRPIVNVQPKVVAIDSTAFNTQLWDISVDDLVLTDCVFRYDGGTRTPYRNEFDPAHMNIKDINLMAENIDINADTLTARLNHLSAADRSGIYIKKMKADIRVSPTESICDDLYLETNNSRIENYYAMHYSRFPDFNDYVNKVRMVARFRNSKIDSRDVAYFATPLRQYPTIISADGNVSGTVTNLKGKNLKISDEYSIVKGDINIRGLPYINNTYFDYSKGELITSGRGILKYAPSLRNNDDVALENIQYAHFKGDFEGYLNNFAVNGIITSNLGTIRSNVVMKLPSKGYGTATYSGTINTQAFDIGRLLRNSDVGIIAMNANVQGNALTLDQAEVRFKSDIPTLEYKGYTYTGISADGVLSKKKFNGNLIIDDPNISLGFYGLFDFSGEELVIDAKANVLQSNLTALKLVKGDTLRLAADFDLDWKGNNIDNFTGTARLYNIDLRRKEHKLDVDSVFISALENGNQKKLIVQSNPFTANLEGEYTLTRLPQSLQYYLAGYIPNYIKIPEGNVPEQDLKFKVVTHDLDSLFAVLLPKVSGFNKSTLTGSLNTSQQKLELFADVPYGKVNNIRFKDIGITGDGDFNTLSLNADAGRITFTDSTTYGSLSINTTLQEDKLDFIIATSSPNAFSTAKIKGTAYAHGDTLDARILPSEFYLDDTRWQIPGNNKIVYTDGYLFVNNLLLEAGLQKINIYTQNQGLTQRLNFDVTNLDITEIAGPAGYAYLEPEGRLNGSIILENLFDDLSVRTNVKATDLKLLKNNIGNVILSGNYNGTHKTVNLNPETGIYNNDQSATVSGKISFDSTNTEYIDGRISFNNTPLSWVEPFAVDIVSKLQGSLNGQVNIKGTSVTPDISGKGILTGGSAHIDFLGVDYSIPKIDITMDNNTVSFNNVTIYDQYNNTALLTGGLRHNRLKNIAFDLNIASDKFEVIELDQSENDLFYGTLIAKFRDMSIKGQINDVSINIEDAEPAAKSHLFLPIETSDNDLGTYSYITFKSYGKEQTIEKKSTSKLSVHIDALINPLATITMILDPSTGDAINAKGTGNLVMDFPPDNDIRMYGNYYVDEGEYIFTLRELFFRRRFILNTGSLIQFTGPIDNTLLNVEGVYETRARLYDLLNGPQKQLVEGLDGQYSREEQEAKALRDINVLLFMRGTLIEPDLSFMIDVPDKSASGTIAYKKLEQINQNERERFNQVASLLLINSFIPPDGGFENNASAGVINNVSDILSGTASSQLTNLVSKLTGDEDLAIDFKYRQYSYNTGSTVAASGQRNALSLGLRKSLFQDRLNVQLGSSVDWGRPVSSTNNGTNFNPVGDFRLQYLLKEGGNLQLNVFSNNNYDVLLNRNITRNGAGISWKKTFNHFPEFLGIDEKSEEKEKQLEKEKENIENNATKNVGP